MQTQDDYTGNPKLGRLLDWPFTARREITRNGYLTKCELVYQMKREEGGLRGLRMMVDIAVGCRRGGRFKYKRPGQRWLLQPAIILPEWKWQHHFVECPPDLEYRGPISFAQYRQMRSLLEQAWLNICARLRSVEEAWEQLGE